MKGIWQRAKAAYRRQLVRVYYPGHHWHMAGGYDRRPSALFWWRSPDLDDTTTFQAGEAYTPNPLGRVRDVIEEFAKKGRQPS